MTARSIDVFFYGYFMDVDLLRSQGVSPTNPRRAFVDEFALRIGRRATLVPAAGQRVYGMIISLTHDEILRLYSAPGLEHYLPEAVIAHTFEGRDIPALCYSLAQPPAASEQNREYLSKLLSALRKLGFPPEYISSVEHATDMQSPEPIASRLRFQ
ncbi:gamma-glutamylcyclotransferase [bacterium]|nr:gamma-glutamylcyclotransferase [bacterium]